jgi:hypothetical protein
MVRGIVVFGVVLGGILATGGVANLRSFPSILVS